MCTREAPREITRDSTLQAKIGIVTGVVSGIASIPFVFSVKLARWFNREFVTTDVPQQIYSLNRTPDWNKNFTTTMCGDAASGSTA